MGPASGHRSSATTLALVIRPGSRLPDALCLLVFLFDIGPPCGAAIMQFCYNSYMPSRRRLFTPAVPEEKLNDAFKGLRQFKTPAVGMMEEVFESYDDMDGNFVEQFQTTGFDSRVWELYLHACFLEWGFTIGPSRRPDFVLTANDTPVCVEAVTANTSQNRPDSPEDEAFSSDGPQTMEDFVREELEIAPIRLGSALYSKLQNRYWELEAVKKKPLILAVEAFYRPGPLYLADSALQSYLYGCQITGERDSVRNLIIVSRPIDSHRHGTKEIPSGFYRLPNAENISAVLFSNSGTVAKFNRMGQLGRHRRSDIRMFRTGTCYNSDPNASEPMSFIYEVGDQRFPETWRQGLSMSHNPNAKHPVPKELFPDIAHHSFEDGIIFSENPASIRSVRQRT